MAIPSPKAPPVQLVAKIAVAVLTLLTVHQTSMAEVRTRNNLAFIEINIQDNLISADLIEAPLEDILLAIGKQAGFKPHLSGDLSERLTLTFTDIPLEKGLKRLVGKHSLSLLYNQPQSSTPETQNGDKEIAEIWVISRTGSSSGMRTVPEQVSIAPENPDEIPAGQEPSLSPPTTEQDMVQPDALPAEEKDDSAELQQAMDDLLERGDTAAVTAAAAFLNHENGEFRRMTIEGLSTVQTGDSTRALGRVLSDEPDAELRMIALRALAEREGDPDAETIMGRALNDPDQEIQALANQLLNQ